jgi:hypothetical protein
MDTFEVRYERSIGAYTKQTYFICSRKPPSSAKLSGEPDEEDKVKAIAGQTYFLIPILTKDEISFFFFFFCAEASQVILYQKLLSQLTRSDSPKSPTRLCI